MVETTLMIGLKIALFLGVTDKICHTTRITATQAPRGSVGVDTVSNCSNLQPGSARECPFQVTRK